VIEVISAYAVVRQQKRSMDGETRTLVKMFFFSSSLSSGTDCSRKKRALSAVAMISTTVEKLRSVGSILLF
jgi:hypothetical protein